MSDPRPGDRDPALPEALEDEVLRALEQDDTTRDTVLARLLEREPDHATKIRRWLHDAGVPIEGDREAHGDESGERPRRLGQYRIVRMLGRGGFGTVFLGEPDDGGDPVAIKLLNEGMNSREVLRRFAAEREALMRLDHKGIARHIGSFATAAGRPFFVMEFVPGSPLLVHCRRTQATLKQRLELFLRVVDAVTHAHQRGILHRDLSANNVLVAGAGEHAQPKIIDFGIAKSVAGPLLGDGTLTFQGTLMGTPEYMSPEQATGQLGAIDTRTDVYSLGVQLYELLTDQLPIPSHVLRAQGVAGIAEMLRTHVPPRPSQIAPRSIQGALRGDLDSITMRALAKERDERYASAAEFAADLRRHLAHEPVVATTPSTWYLLRKFALRHRAQFALAVATILVLVGALAISVQQWQVAQEARSELKLAHDSLTKRAAAGFRLLAGQQRLRRAELEVEQLQPAWPARAAAMQTWLRDHGAPMRALLEELDQREDQLERDRSEASNGRGELDLVEALQQMRFDLRKFFGAGGAFATVERRLAFAEVVVEPALQRDADAWRSIANELQRSSSSFGPQPGLAPLGRCPTTGLFEFLDLASHPRGTPLPSRDAAGNLVTAPDCGIVFVLMLRSTVQLGAQHDDPGMERFDPQAETDELFGRTAILDDYFVARTELTRAQWAQLSNSELGEGGNLPQTDIDWFETRVCLRVFGMDLPTEAQWEHACRAGSTTPWSSGPGLDVLVDVANLDRSLEPVARLQPNAFGLYDVHGNAAEWCLDWKCDYRKATLRSKDGLQELPTPVRLPELRAVRGGSALGGAASARSSARSGRSPSTRDSFVGVRPVRAVVRNHF
ncbi:MAG: bifunctional serine/threonine-protein kinase/formylglycine-generating enzyme family protein [Planctomycetota bacterium]